MKNAEMWVTVRVRCRGRGRKSGILRSKALSSEVTCRWWFQNKEIREVAIWTNGSRDIPQSMAALYVAEIWRTSDILIVFGLWTLQTTNYVIQEYTDQSHGCVCGSVAVYFTQESSISFCQCWRQPKVCFSSRMIFPDTRQTSYISCFVARSALQSSECHSLDIAYIDCTGNLVFHSFSKFADIITCLDNISQRGRTYSATGNSGREKSWKSVSADGRHHTGRVDQGGSKRCRWTKPKMETSVGARRHLNRIWSA